MLSWPEVGAGSHTPLVVRDTTGVGKAFPGGHLSRCPAQCVLPVVGPPRGETEAPGGLWPSPGFFPTPPPCPALHCSHRKLGALRHQRGTMTPNGVEGEN